MNANGCNIDAMIKLRRSIHQNAEGAFKEFQTQKLLLDTLISFGIDKKCIKKSAITGLVVDIMGTAAPEKGNT